MSPVEITMSIVLFLLVPAFAAKVAYNIVQIMKRNEEKRKKLINQINATIQNGINSINGINMSDTEREKMILKKSKFISKIENLIYIISICLSVPTQTIKMRDNLIGAECAVEILPYQDVKLEPHLSDYTFISNILTELVTHTKFPSKDDYFKLNRIYAKYKKLKKGNNEKL